MFASVRRYRMHKGSMDELARRVDEGFAEEICRSLDSSRTNSSTAATARS